LTENTHEILYKKLKNYLEVIRPKYFEKKVKVFLQLKRYSGKKV